MELAQRKGQMQWVTRIMEALERDRLTLYCQHLKPLRSGCPERVEILLRMLDSNNEIIAPMAFIPAAERYNLMADVDRWVIRNLCTHLRTAHDQVGDTVFNINLSGLSLSDRTLATFIMEVIDKSGFAPDRFCFEITETAAVNSLDTVLQLAETLQLHGATFSLDDFGSGLSSFNYLKTLPVQQIKIDGTFVRNMLQDPLDQALVRSVVDIARVLGIQVCAEFVEDEATLDHLRDIGVDYAQGYAIGYPMPLQSFLAKIPVPC